MKVPADSTGMPSPIPPRRFTFVILGALALGVVLLCLGHGARTDGRVNVAWWNNSRFEGSPVIRETTRLPFFRNVSVPPGRISLRDDKWSALVEGTLWLPSDGTWSPYLTSDDAASLWIDGEEIVSLPGMHPPKTGSQSRNIKAGPHPFCIRYQQMGGQATLDLRLAKQHGRPAPIPDSFLSPPGTTTRTWARASRSLGAGAIVLVLFIGLVRGLVHFRHRLCQRTADFLRKPRDLGWYLFYGLLALHILPIIVLPYFPTQDGAAHVASGRDFIHFFLADGWLIRDWLQPSPMLEPNLMGHVFFGLAQLVLPCVWAEKLFVVGYFLTTAMGVRAILKSMNHDYAWAAVLVLPMLMHWPLRMGFYNFTMGLPVMLWTIALWLQHRDELHDTNIFAISLLAVAAYFCHPVPAVIAALTMGALSLGVSGAQLVSAWRHHRTVPREIIKAVLHRLGMTAFALFPLALLLSNYLIADKESGALPGFGHLKEMLLNGDVFTTMRDSERVPAKTLTLALAALLGLAIIVKILRRHLVRWDALFIIFAGMVFLTLSSSDAMGGGFFLIPRLFLLTFLTLVLWLGVVPWPRLMSSGIQWAFFGISFWFLTLRTVNDARAQSTLGEVVSAATVIEKDRTILALPYDRHGSGESYNGRMAAYLHVGGYVAAASQSLNLNLYEYHVPHFPMRWRDDLSPPSHLSVAEGLERDEPCIDIGRFELDTRERIDYVLTMKMPQEDHPNPCVRNLLRELRSHYTEVFASHPSGYARVFKRIDQ